MLVGTPCAGKLACTVWGGGKPGDCIKRLPITIPLCDIVKIHDMPKCASVEDAYRMMLEYRLIRFVEYADLIASRKSI